MKSYIKSHIRPIHTIAVLFLLLLVAVMPAAAQEIPCPMPPPCPAGAMCPVMPPCPPRQPGVFTNPEWLRIDHHQVTVSIKDQIATTNVDMEFRNEGSALAEGTF